MAIYQQCVTIYHVPKCMSCHKVNMVITARAVCFHDCICITFILRLCDLSTLCVVDHFTYDYIYVFKLAERIDHLPKPETFITLKDHKPSCRLINPTKNEQGKISKKIIEQINQEILKKTDVNQWRNTSNVIN